MLEDTQLKRAAGILLPVSSLPSPYGIGTFGKAAYRFVDQLHEAGQKYWQVLPLGSTSYGDSPYQSFSAFAGNPYFIDLDVLIDEGLLEKSEVTKVNWGREEDRISYEALWDNRYRILHLAYKRSTHKRLKKYREFVKENEDWLEDYALFMACKAHFGHQEWLKWDEDIRLREPEAVAKYEKQLRDEVGFYIFLQYKFFEQWILLKEYANKQDVEIIGDMPIYVALDSADVWVNPQLFELDEDRKPVRVAGCPPDAFSDEGQKWGNPLYDWKAMEQEDFAWWKRRMAGAARLYDVVRIDHFIGVVRYYTIPADDSAKNGTFEWGPGEKLTKALDEVRGETKIIAEDLGVTIPQVDELLEKAGYPGMRILEFAFDGNNRHPYLPHMYPRNCIVYGGTHDNETLRGYFDHMKKKDIAYALEYTDSSSKEELIHQIFLMTYRSVANTVIFQMQDVLEKGNEARMNLPSTIGENWRWRLKKNEFTKKQIKWLNNLTKLYGRD
ncbi:MAG: 4-alpha-glucanotransferase [Lachnospiraceae bacterium]|nr:4-alpha-glucanotransferase [Lachnospiraceae bacterium]